MSVLDNRTVAFLEKLQAIIHSSRENGTAPEYKAILRQLDQEIKTFLNLPSSISKETSTSTSTFRPVPAPRVLSTSGIVKSPAPQSVPTTSISKPLPPPRTTTSKSLVEQTPEIFSELEEHTLKDEKLYPFMVQLLRENFEFLRGLYKHISSINYYIKTTKDSTCDTTLKVVQDYIITNNVHNAYRQNQETIDLIRQSLEEGYLPKPSSIVLKGNSPNKKKLSENPTDINVKEEELYPDSLQFIQDYSKFLSETDSTIMIPYHYLTNRVPKCVAVRNDIITKTDKDMSSIIEMSHRINNFLDNILEE